MEIDYDFLREYLGHEIKRLTKVANALDISIRDYKNKKDEAQIDVPQYRRDWQFGRRLEKLDGLIGEATIKLTPLKERLHKLREVHELLEANRAA